MIAIGSLRSGGSSTLALTLVGSLADAGCVVLLIDAARDPDLLRRSHRAGCPDLISVARGNDNDSLRELVHTGRRQGRAVIIEAGFRRDRLRAAFELLCMALVHAQFSPLSASAAIEADRLNDQTERRRSGGRAFVTTAVTRIPRRIARAVELQLPAGLSLRAAFEAPFLLGGTVHTLGEADAPGPERARAEAENLRFEPDLHGFRRSIRPSDAPASFGEPPRVMLPAPVAAQLRSVFA